MQQEEVVEKGKTGRKEGQSAMHPMQQKGRLPLGSQKGQEPQESQQKEMTEEQVQKESQEAEKRQALVAVAAWELQWAQEEAEQKSN